MALVARGLVATRTRAQRLIREGAVSVDGVVVRKPSMVVDDGAVLVADQGEDYVSRGALKLVGAFVAFADRGLRSAQGRQCLDIGASTGGFCDVLLRQGARAVVALDVGHGQLAPRIAADERVTDMSGVNIREVTAQTLPFRPQVVVSDVSFISLTYVIPVIADIAAPGADVVLLIKPQFEVGKGRLGKGGVVDDETLRDEAVRRVVACAREHGLTVVGVEPSPIEGTHGNAEYLLCARA